MSLGIIPWLWLIAAALIPVMVHLWNRRSGTPQMLPTFRFLPEKSFARAGRIELHEIWLLLFRIGLIILVALLLAGLFFDEEKESLESVKITETESEYSEEWIGDGILEISVQSDRVDRVGWWKLLEQIEYDHRPGLIIVEGDFSMDRFRGNVSALYANLEWVNRDLQNELWQTTWLNSEGSTFGYVQRRSENGVEHEIEAVEQELAEPGLLQLSIRSDADPSLRRGFEEISNLWNFNLMNADLPGNQLAVAKFGEHEIELNLTESSGESPEKLMPGPHFGVHIPVTVLNDSLRNRNAMVETTITKVPVLWLDDQNEMILNAEPDAEYSQWFYAGVAHQLLKAAMRIDESLMPEITEELRDVLKVEEATKAGLIERNSASNWLFLLLLLVWAAERVVAQRRDM